MQAEKGGVSTFTRRVRQGCLFAYVLIPTHAPHHIHPTPLIGALAKRLNLPSESAYWSKGVTACAICDGAAPIFRCRFFRFLGAVVTDDWLSRCSCLLNRMDLIGMHAVEGENVQKCVHAFAHTRREGGRSSQSPHLTTHPHPRRDEPLAVIGGGDSAAEEAVYLTKYSPKIHLLVRSGQVGMGGWRWGAVCCFVGHVSC